MTIVVSKNFSLCNSVFHPPSSSYLFFISTHEDNEHDDDEECKGLKSFHLNCDSRERKNCDERKENGWA